jgi:hypothetical protein
MCQLVLFAKLPASPQFQANCTGVVEWRGGRSTRCIDRNQEMPMRYLCLVHFEPSIIRDPTFDKSDLDRRSLAYDEELKAAGHYVASEAVFGGDSAVLVRVRGGKMAATDGPYIETKEQMGGFILIEARDMNDAVRLAAGIPIAEIGTIEVRPIFEIPTPPPVP